jgi:D-alanyl-lipoteichoic acid acyltransferase DltB (MBOAT superfamily)
MGLIGLWHGVTWNFLIWGLWHGAGLFVQNRWSQATRGWGARLAARPVLTRAYTALSTLLTFHYVALGWVWFALPTPPLAARVFGVLFGGG